MSINHLKNVCVKVRSTLPHPQILWLIVSLLQFYYLLLSNVQIFKCAWMVWDGMKGGGGVNGTGTGEICFTTKQEVLLSLLHHRRGHRWGWAPAEPLYLCDISRCFRQPMKRGKDQWFTVPLKAHTHTSSLTHNVLKIWPCSIWKDWILPSKLIWTILSCCIIFCCVFNHKHGPVCLDAFADKKRTFFIPMSLLWPGDWNRSLSWIWAVAIRTSAVFSIIVMN